VTLLLEKIRADRAALGSLATGQSATPGTIGDVRDLLGVDDAIAFQNGVRAPRQH
jgi:hypothetical protein